MNTGSPCMGDVKPRLTRISHFGNTANNAYFNHLILRGAGLPSKSEIRVSSLGIHAMSAPSWEEMSFVPSNDEWIKKPRWADVPGANHFNRSFMSVNFAQTARAKIRQMPIPPFFMWFLKRVSATLRAISLRLSSLIFLEAGSDRNFPEENHQHLTRKGSRRKRSERIAIVYGSSFPRISISRRPRGSRVHFEHGTLRWNQDHSDPKARVQQKLYEREVRLCSHVWVTNLDPPSLHEANRIAKDKWAAFPHPYSFYRGALEVKGLPSRSELKNRLDADFLIFLPASQNWKTPSHNKGSDIAWQAVANLRDSGLRVGVVASEWGLDLHLARILIQNLGLKKNVFWIPPLPRAAFLQFVREVDVCWDQFIIEGFGGVALRAVEAGVPLVGQGLSEDAIGLTGFQVPWAMADSPETIFCQTRDFLNETISKGRKSLRESTTVRYHSWFHKHHSPQLTADMQNFLFGRIAAGDQTPFPSDLWKQMAVTNGPGSYVTPRQR